MHPEPKMALACLFWTSLGTTITMQIFGGIARKRVLASLCLLVPVPAVSTRLLTEIDGKYFSWINSLIRFSLWLPSSWTDAAKRLQKERI